MPFFHLLFNLLENNLVPSICSVNFYPIPAYIFSNINSICLFIYFWMSRWCFLPLFHGWVFFMTGMFLKYFFFQFALEMILWRKESNIPDISIWSNLALRVVSDGMDPIFCIASKLFHAWKIVFHDEILHCFAIFMSHFYQ